MGPKGWKKATATAAQNAAPKNTAPRRRQRTHADSTDTAASQQQQRQPPPPSPQQPPAPPAAAAGPDRVEFTINDVPCVLENERGRFTPAVAFGKYVLLKDVTSGRLLLPNGIDGSVHVTNGARYITVRFVGANLVEASTSSTGAPPPVTSTAAPAAPAAPALVEDTALVPREAAKSVSESAVDSALRDVQTYAVSLELLHRVDARSRNIARDIPASTCSKEELAEFRRNLMLNVLHTKQRNEELNDA